jgi:hypothetical protein
MTIATYQPDFVTVAFNGVPITGFAPGTFVSAARNNDTWNMSVGSGGDATRAKSGDRSGRVTITLLGSSKSNAALAAMAKIDERLGTQVAPLQVKDLSGDDLVFCGTAWIVKPPNIEKSNEETNREWIFETDDLETYAGGNVPLT